MYLALHVIMTNRAYILSNFPQLSGCTLMYSFRAVCFVLAVSHCGECLIAKTAGLVEVASSTYYSNISKVITNALKKIKQLLLPM